MQQNRSDRGETVKSRKTTRAAGLICLLVIIMIASFE